jgi:uncharacterized protein YoaH (UPF0181 family)
MKQEFIDRIEREISDLRTKFDQLKVKAGLAKLEFRERVVTKLGAALDDAAERVKKLRAAGSSEWEALKSAAEASLREFRETYRKHADKDH